jgi:hypothetical protein
MAGLTRRTAFGVPGSLPGSGVGPAVGRCTPLFEGTPTPPMRLSNRFRSFPCRSFLPQFVASEIDRRGYSANRFCLFRATPCSLSPHAFPIHCDVPPGEESGSRSQLSDKTGHRPPGIQPISQHHHDLGV